MVNAGDVCEDGMVSISSATPEPAFKKLAATKKYESPKVGCESAGPPGKHDSTGLAPHSETGHHLAQACPVEGAVVCIRRFFDHENSVSDQIRSDQLFSSDGNHRQQVWQSHRPSM